MIKRIDFIGPPGVGKTVLYEKLIKHEKLRLLTPQSAAFKSAKVVCRQNNTLVYKLIGIGLNFGKVKNSLANMVLKKSASKDKIKIFSEYNDFLKSADELYCKSNRQFDYKKLLGFQSFLTNFMKQAVIGEKLQTNKWLIDDESLSQKVFNLYGIREYEVKDDDLLVNYFRKIPKPSLIIVVNGTPQEIIYNIKKRSTEGGKTIPGHLNIDESELKKRVECAIKVTNIAVETYKEEGVDVIEAPREFEELVKILMKKMASKIDG